MSIESPYSSLLSGSSTTAVAPSCAVGTGTMATVPSSRASVGSEMGAPPWRPLRRVLCDALALGPRGLEDKGLLLCLAGTALLRAPANFSFRTRSGGAGRVTLTGLNFNGRLGGATGTAPASLLGIVSLSGRFGTALAGVALLCPSLLFCPGPSSQGLP